MWSTVCWLVQVANLTMARPKSIPPTASTNSSTDATSASASQSDSALVAGDLQVATTVLQTVIATVDKLPPKHKEVIVKSDGFRTVRVKLCECVCMYIPVILCVLVCMCVFVCLSGKLFLLVSKRLLCCCYSSPQTQLLLSLWNTDAPSLLMWTTFIGGQSSCRVSFRQRATF